MKKSLVTVIVPTKNSSEFLDVCLKSIRGQTYKHIEIIVVDNNSTDGTKKIAKKYTDQIFNRGPERSAQVNFGASKSRGEFIYKVDSDFILEKNVIKECIERIKEGFDAVVVHNSPDEKVSWIAQIRKFEVDMYKYDLTHSSARFLYKDVFIKIGGFNEKITAGEDYDFQNKLNRLNFKTGFIDAEAIHLGEPRKFFPHMKKYYLYGKSFVEYKKHNLKESKEQLKFNRSIYWKHWARFATHPIKTVCFVFYNLCKFSAGGIGYMAMRIKNYV